MNFLLENAPPPYEGTFVQTGSGQIRVELFMTGQTSSFTGSTSGQGTTVTAILGEPLNPLRTPTAANPEVRLDLCVVAPNMSSCSPTDGSGIPGAGITGTLGDAFISHVLSLPCPQVAGPCDQTPAIYFIEDARDMVNAVFASQGGQTLYVQLFINGELLQSNKDTGNVIITRDL